jgi:hypothetical protein
MVLRSNTEIPEEYWRSIFGWSEPIKPISGTRGDTG